MSEEKKLELQEIFDQISQAVEDNEAELAGDRIKQFRDSIGLKSSVFARRVGASEQAVYRWIKGSSVPKESHLMAFKQLLEQASSHEDMQPIWPKAIGLLTWQQVMEHDNDPSINRIWLCSGHAFLEACREEQAKLLERVKQRDVEYCFVFPAETDAAKSFSAIRKYLSDYAESSPMGQVTGYQLPVPPKWGLAHLLPVRFALFESRESIIAYVSVPIGNNELKFFQSQPIQGLSFIWKEIDKAAANAIYYEFCHPLTEMIASRSAKQSEQTSEDSKVEVFSTFEKQTTESGDQKLQ